MAYPIQTRRGDEDTARAHKMLGYKNGGRVKSDEGGTNIHIEINGTPAKTNTGPDPAMLGALAQAAQPPPPPPMPMGGGPDMGGPGLGGPGAGPGPIAMRRGGRVAESSAARTAKPGQKLARGGVAQLTNSGPDAGGAGGGHGRLRKASIA